MSPLPSPNVSVSFHLLTGPQCALWKQKGRSTTSSVLTSFQLFRESWWFFIKGLKNLWELTNLLPCTSLALFSYILIELCTTQNALLHFLRWWMFWNTIYWCFLYSWKVVNSIKYFHIFRQISSILSNHVYFSQIVPFYTVYIIYTEDKLKNTKPDHFKGTF